MTLCNWGGGMVRDIWKDHKRGCVRPAEAADHMQMVVAWT